MKRVLVLLFALLLCLGAMSFNSFASEEPKAHFGVTGQMAFDTPAEFNDATFQGLGGYFEYNVAHDMGLYGTAVRWWDVKDWSYGAGVAFHPAGVLFIPIGYEYAADSANDYVNLGFGLETWGKHVGLQITPKYYRNLDDFHSADGDYFTLNLGILFK